MSIESTYNLDGMGEILYLVRLENKRRGFNNMSVQIQLSFGKSCRSNKVTKSPVKSWAEWVDVLMNHKVGKKDGEYLLLGFCDGDRAADNMKECSMFAVDADGSLDASDVGAPAVGDAVKALEAMGIEAVLTTSFSHGSEKGTRYRIWIPTSRSYTKKEIKKLSRAVHRALNDAGCAVAETIESSRYAQLWFLPRHAEGAPFEVAHAEGELLDVDAMIDSVEDDDGVVEPASVSDVPSWLEAQGGVSGAESVVDSRGRTIAEKYCDAVPVGSLLEAAGYTKEKEGRWLRPDSTTGLAGCVEYDDPERGRTVVKEFGGGGVLATGKIHDAFDIMRLSQCDGDMDKALVRAASAVAAEEQEGQTVENEGNVNLATLPLRTTGGKTGSVKRNERNAAVVLEGSPMFRVGGVGSVPVFSYDTFERRVIVEESFVQTIHKRGSEVVDWSQIVFHVTMLLDEVVSDFEVQHFGKTAAGGWQPRMVEAAIEYVAKQNTFDPLVQWLDALPEWDGVARVETFMGQMLGVDNNIYTRAAMRKFMCGAVARGYKGGVNFQLVPVLIGKQGLGKSPIMSVLFGEERYTDAHLPIAKPLDVMALTSGKWVAEAAEQLNRGTVSNEAYKAFVSAQADRARRMYGKDEVVLPRRFVMYSTSNNVDFGIITDRTGGKRLLPLHCTKPMTPEDFKWLYDNRDQLWAEAKVMWRAGEKLYMDGEAAAAALEMQESEMVESNWHDEVVEFLAVEDGDDGFRPGHPDYPLVDAHDRRSQRAGMSCVQEIYNHLVDCGVAEGVLGARERVDIESTLCRMGWHKRRKGEKGFMQRFDGMGSKRAWFAEGV